MSNIGYKLASELKEVGFPQEGTGGFISNPKCKGWDKEIDLDSCMSYMPTLSELIEECGEMFGSLIRYPKRWDCIPDWNTDCIKAMNIIGTEGKTPEEAVANLYIKLNERNKSKD